MKALLTPHIFEKTYQLASDATHPIYTFKLSQDLDKGMVKKLVEKEFSVHVTSVRIINIPGKARRFKGIPGRKSVVRKAMVRLKAGEKITAFDLDTKQEGK